MITFEKKISTGTLIRDRRVITNLLYNLDFHSVSCCFINLNNFIQKFHFHSKILVSFKKFVFTFKKLFSFKTLFSSNNFSVCIHRHGRRVMWTLIRDRRVITNLLYNLDFHSVSCCFINLNNFIQKFHFHSKILVSFKKFVFTFKKLFSFKTLFSSNNFSVCIHRHGRRVM